MPSRDLTIYPYDLPGGASNTDVLISLELVDADSAPQPGYDTVTGAGVVGTYTHTMRSEAITLALAATEGLTPQLYWLFKARWGSASGYRLYTSGLIELASAGGAITLSEFLSLAEIPGTITGLTADEIAAIRAADSPSAANPFATMAIFDGLTVLAVVDALPDPQVAGTLYMVKS